MFTSADQLLAFLLVIEIYISNKKAGERQTMYFNLKTAREILANKEALLRKKQFLATGSPISSFFRRRIFYRPDYDYVKSRMR